MGQSFRWIVQVLDIPERDRKHLNLRPKGEPQLGRRGLYSGYGSGKDAMQRNMAVLWVLNLSDGDHSPLDIAERADLPFDLIASAASALVSHDLLAESTARHDRLACTDRAPRPSSSARAPQAAAVERSH